MNDWDDNWHIVGEYDGYEIWTRGVFPPCSSEVVGVWCSLPHPDNLLDEVHNRRWRSGEECWNIWLLFQYDSWGATSLTGVPEEGAILASIGHMNGDPVMLEVLAYTGDDKNANDVDEFIAPLYEALLYTLQEECSVPLGEKQKW